MVPFWKNINSVLKVMKSLNLLEEKQGKMEIPFNTSSLTPFYSREASQYRILYFPVTWQWSVLKIYEKYGLCFLWYSSFGTWLLFKQCHSTDFNLVSWLSVAQKYKYLPICALRQPCLMHLQYLVWDKSKNYENSYSELASVVTV